MHRNVLHIRIFYTYIFHVFTYISRIRIMAILQVENWSIHAFSKCKHRQRRSLFELMSTIAFSYDDNIMVNTVFRWKHWVNTLSAVDQININSEKPEKLLNVQETSKKNIAVYIEKKNVEKKKKKDGEILKWIKAWSFFSLVLRYICRLYRSVTSSSCKLD